MERWRDGDSQRVVRAYLPLYGCTDDCTPPYSTDRTDLDVAPAAHDVILDGAHVLALGLRLGAVVARDAAVVERVPEERDLEVGGAVEGLAGGLLGERAEEGVGEVGHGVCDDDD